MHRVALAEGVGSSALWRIALSLTRCVARPAAAEPPSARLRSRIWLELRHWVAVTGSVSGQVDAAPYFTRIQLTINITRI